MRTSARALVAALVLASAAAALVAAGACLPDLSAISAEDAALEGSVAPFQGCGDGVIATLDDGGDAGESCDPGADAQAVPGCRACQITCEDKLDPRTGHCYFVVGAATTYAAARDQCQAAKAHIVTLASAAELTLVRAIAADESGYWIGLARQDADYSGAYGPPFERVEEPGFAYPLAPVAAAAGPCPGCFGVGADGGVFPVADVAVDASATATCVASRGGSWFQVPCNGSINRPTVCEREPGGGRGKACGNDGICFTLPQTAGEKTYLVAVSPADPETADTTCRFLDGGSLVVLDSREEREQLAHEIYRLNPLEQQLWIGLHADGGTWAWDDGVVATEGSTRPLPWGNAQPTGGTNARAFIRVGAAAYDTQLAYADDGGGGSRLFICQRPAR